MVGRLIAAVLLFHSVRALNYLCEDNKVLIVQNFGKDSIRMHCSHLDLCGYKQLKCRYEDNLPRCEGHNTFVSHVRQTSETGPVSHSCCTLESPVPVHDSNNCFVYQLPDSHPDGAQQVNDEETLLTDASSVEETIGNYTGYRLKLFLLKNKTPPKLLVQGIERKEDGFAVSICRPHCNPFPDNTLSSISGVGGTTTPQPKGNDGGSSRSTSSGQGKGGHVSGEDRLPPPDEKGVIGNKGAGDKNREKIVEPGGGDNGNGGKVDNNGGHGGGNSGEHGGGGSETTKAPATQPPATPPPTTRSPATPPPTTRAPATPPPTTRSPATPPPTTRAPATPPPTTRPPATPAPTTQAPATPPPTTRPPATPAPTTQAPATPPPTTRPPATPPPTTQAPATPPPTTQAPVTQPQPPPETTLSTRLASSTGARSTDGTAATAPPPSAPDHPAVRLPSNIERASVVQNPGVAPASQQVAALPAPSGGTSAQQSPQVQAAAQPASDSHRHCFSGEARVQTSAGTKLMKDLRIGDEVLVPATRSVFKYERVEMFYHRNPEIEAEFIVLVTRRNKTIIVTENHLLPMGDCGQMGAAGATMEDLDVWMRRSMFARRAKVGDCLLTVTGSRLLPDRIVQVSRRIERGIYSPMTMDGSIVADNVLASCFSHVESHAIQKLIYDTLHKLGWFASWLVDFASHFVLEAPMALTFAHQLSAFVLPFSSA